jgi:carbamoyltransferase
VKYLHKITGLRDLCISGGIGLNCSLNMHLHELDIVDRLFVQPAASDRGLALGCAMQICNELKIKMEPINHLYYGPTYTENDILDALGLVGFDYKKVNSPESYAANLLAQGKIIGWFQGRSEFGPRALGNRSIIADPRAASMKDEVNARIKFREEFRPFAPAVLESEASKIFCMNEISPFMTMAFNVREEWKSKLGATTHVNGTARVQTVSAEHSPRFYKLISEFNKLTGVPVLLNTSFNIKGQPIVETPLDAISTFAGTGLDALFLGDYVIEKTIKPRGKILK